MRMLSGRGFLSLGPAGAVQSEWPNASNTGVQNGITLTDNSGNISSSGDNTTIQNFNVTAGGQIIIHHSGVIVRNCRAMSVAILGPNALVEYCDFIGVVDGGTDNTCVGVGDINAEVRYCDISGTENGFYVSPAVGVSTTMNLNAHDNYIHDLDYPIPDPHTDGLQIDNANSLTIRHNNFDLNIPGITSDIIMPAGTNNILIDNNRLGSINVAIYLNGTNLTVTNNVFIRGAGSVAGTDWPTATYSNNTFEDGGTWTAPGG